jgi:formate hydrogenlyase subunit 6/NADH:ubiquinone oxidoreductase subunit I
MYVARCTFCAQCVDACPVNALATTEEFLLADTDCFSRRLIVD